MTTTHRGGRYHTRTWQCECGTHSFASRAHCYGCGKPRPEPVKAVVCGRRTVNGSGYRTTCLKPAGHKGVC